MFSAASVHKKWGTCSAGVSLRKNQLCKSICNGGIQRTAATRYLDYLDFLDYLVHLEYLECLDYLARLVHLEYFECLDYLAR